MKNIRTLRKQRGWTQARMAKRLGISQGWLSQIELGKQVLPEASKKKLKALALSQ